MAYLKNNVEIEVLVPSSRPGGDYSFAIFTMEEFEVLAMVMVKSFQPIDHGNSFKGQIIVVVEVPG